MIRSLPRFLALLALLPLGVQAAPELPLPAQAVARIGSPQVIAAPDRADWTYLVGQPITFKVTVLLDDMPLPGATIRYRVGPEKLEGEEVTLTSADGTFTIPGGKLDQPGFIRCLIKTEVLGKTYEGVASAAIEPTRIAPTQANPADFDAFWQAALTEQASKPLRLQKTLVPERCTPGANVYHVSYDVWSKKHGITRFYGMLAEPVEPGKYPAVLQVPGAGVRPYAGLPEWAEQGLIVLQLGIHGIPVNLSEPLYQNLRAGGLRDYPEYFLDNRDDYFYQRVYLGCVRGNEVLTQHPWWDGKNLICAGGSQGGQLSIVVSALDPRITGTVSNYPAYCDVTGYLHGRAGGWPHMFANGRNNESAKIATTGYYDTVNFARRLRAPISMAFGYNDTVCPPTSMFAAYNVITAPKELQLQLEMGHPSSPEFSARYLERVVEMATGK